MTMLDVSNLNVRFNTADGTVNAVNDLSFSMQAGDALAIVGESGSGKSQSAFAMLGLLSGNGNATGSVKFNAQQILNVPEKSLNAVRAEGIGMVFQDPMSSLNPYMRVVDQMCEVLIYHRGLSKSTATQHAIQMLDAVRIPDARSRITLYPHEFSGGMRQRVMIAMALLCKPELLIADEPTTALDVTVQAQIMSLFADLRIEFNMGLLLITHDLGIVAGSCEHVLVLYGGRVMEQGSVHDIFKRPSHPYTQGLLNSILRIDTRLERLQTITGNPPNMQALPGGCAFEPRCQYATTQCTLTAAPLVEFAQGRKRACHVQVGAS